MVQTRTRLKTRKQVKMVVIQVTQYNGVTRLQFMIRHLLIWMTRFLTVFSEQMSSRLFKHKQMFLDEIPLQRFLESELINTLLTSSVLSLQSLSPSQTYSWLIHRWFPQVNWSARHLLYAGNTVSASYIATCKFSHI